MSSFSPEHQARQERVARIRRRVIGGASGLFLLVTGGIVVQLVTGHDPAVATATRARVAATTAPPAQESTAPGATASGPAASGPSSGQVAPLTTRQS